MSDTTLHTTHKQVVQPPSVWTVVFLNDDYTPMAFVVQVLITVFHKSIADAQAIMLTIHHYGRASVGSYTREVASHKADHAMLLATIAQHPLDVHPEPQ